MKLALLALVLIMSSCSMPPPTAEQIALQEERAVDREIMKEQREYDRKMCRAAGGLLLVEQWSGSRPHKRDKVACLSPRQAESILR